MNTRRELEQKHLAKADRLIADATAQIAGLRLDRKTPAAGLAWGSPLPRQLVT